LSNKAFNGVQWERKAAFPISSRPRKSAPYRPPPNYSGKENREFRWGR
jgi:hypothetical protein